MFWIIATVVLATAITYEALQALNRFAALTRDDISTQKQSQKARANITTPLVL